MNEEQLITNIIQEGESDRLEFRELFRKEEVGRVLSSFLNANGGRLLIGVDSDGIITGVTDADLKATELQYFLLEAIVPEAPVTISVERVNNKNIIMAKVFGGSKQPYVYDGNIYYRVGGKTVRATSSQISTLIHGRQLAELHWERRSALGIDLDDLDTSLIKATMEQSRSNHRSAFQGSDLTEFLAHYGLFQDGSFTNACVVLFARKPARILPQIRVRLTEYGSEGKTDDNLLRDHIYEGNLFEIQQDLEKYVANLGIRSVFDKNQWRRIDFRFPEKALQEGVINALMHRDYSSNSSGVSISVFPNSFVISNSGHLPDDLRVSELKRSHRSHPTNPDIAHIVFLRGLIDKLGRGTLKVLEECKKEGLKEPSWKDNNDGVTLSFFGPRALAPKRSSEALDHLVDDLDEGVNDGINDGVVSLIDRAINDGVIDGVNDSIRVEIQRLVRLIANHAGTTTTEIVIKRSKSKPTIERYLRVAKEIGAIEFRGAPKTGGYYITDRLNDFRKKE